jgi:GNAT superfamily N-acetyltransferase
MEIVVYPHRRGFGLGRRLLASHEERYHCGANEHDYDARFHVPSPNYAGCVPRWAL